MFILFLLTGSCIYAFQSPSSILLRRCWCYHRNQVTAVCGSITSSNHWPAYLQHLFAVRLDVVRIFFLACYNLQTHTHTHTAWLHGASRPPPPWINDDFVSSSYTLTPSRQRSRDHAPTNRRNFLRFLLPSKCYSVENWFFSSLYVWKDAFENHHLWM